MKFSYLILLIIGIVGCSEAPEQHIPTAIPISKNTKPTKAAQLENTEEHLPLQIRGDILLPKDYQFSSDDELDLHGKRIKNAQELILAFLESAVKAGKEYALIITGKGLHSIEKFTLDDGSEVGPIKYHFLLWLKNGAFRNYIQDISYANGVHGGEGAFYIHLKKLTANQ